MGKYQDETAWQAQQREALERERTRGVKLELGRVGRHCRIWLDGRPVQDVVEVRVVASVNAVTQVVLTLAPHRVEVHGADVGVEIKRAPPLLEPPEEG